MSVPLAALAAFAVCGPVLAQQADDEVVVESARSSGFVHGLRTGTPIEVITIKRRVSYADLDLATYSGAVELEARVKNSAKSLCDKLVQMRPMSSFDKWSCVRTAVAGGMAEARAAIVAAEKKTRTASR